jgi:2-polyprenyl-6-methoxyphenol hydroxylase-like FAD-dependent oxidoreductase
MTLQGRGRGGVTGGRRGGSDARCGLRRSQLGVALIGHDVDVAVVGGGLGSLTLAIGLLQGSVDVQVFEQSAEIREIGAGVAIGADATRLLARLGVDAASEANVPPRLELRRWDDGPECSPRRPGITAGAPGRRRAASTMGRSKD